MVNLSQTIELNDGKERGERLPMCCVSQRRLDQRCNQYTMLFDPTSPAAILSTPCSLMTSWCPPLPQPRRRHPLPPAPRAWPRAWIPTWSDSPPAERPPVRLCLPTSASGFVLFSLSGGGRQPTHLARSRYAWGDLARDSRIARRRARESPFFIFLEGTDDVLARDRMRHRSGRPPSGRFPARFPARPRA